MKISVNSAVKHIILFILLLLNFLFLYNTVEPKLHFHIQQLSFVYNNEFFKQHLLLPGNLTEYLAAFMAELFYYNFWGSLLIILMAFLIYAAGINITSYFNNKKIGFSFALLPLSFVFPLFTNYYFPFTIVLNILILYCFSAIYIFSLKAKWNIYIVYSILSLFLYYVSGSGIFMIFSANAIIITAFFRKFKVSSFFLFFVVAIAAILPYLAYKYIFNINLSVAYFSLLPDIPHVLKYKTDIFIYFLYFFLPFSLIVLAIIPTPLKESEETEKPKHLFFMKKWGVLVISIVLMVSINYFGIKLKFDKHQKNVALADYYNYHEDWASAKETILSDYKYDIIMNYYYVRTISHLGEFLDSYFTYPQIIGGDALYPDRIESTTTVMISSDYYYDLGYISQAHHWAHEAQTTLPNSPRILKRLVMTNLILGNYTAAGNLISVLSKIPFNTEFVNKYSKYIEDTSLIVSDNEIMEKRALMPGKSVVVNNFAQRMYDLLENRNNKDAYDHLQMYFLLTHRLGNFIKHLSQLPLYHKTIPLLYQEAIMLYSAKTRQLPENLQISSQVQNNVKGFSEIMMHYKGNKEAARNQLQSSYGHTYMYYIVYDSPLVTKAELKVRQE